MAEEDYKNLDNKFNLLKKFSLLDFEVYKQSTVNLKEAGVVCKELKKKFKDLYDSTLSSISDERMKDKKISVDILNFLKDASVYIPVFSMISGWLYSLILLNGFSIKVSDYFSINDYISSSFEYLIKVFLIVMMPIFVAKIVRMESYRKPRFIVDKEDAFFYKYYCFFVLILFICFLFLIIILKKPVYLIWLFSIFITIMLPYLVDRYFKNYQEVYIFLFVSILFFGFISFSAFDQIEKIKNKEKIIKIQFEKDIKFNSYFTFIAKNSGYYFLYDKANSRFVVVPVNQVKFVEYPNEVH